MSPIQAEVERVRPLAVQLAIEQARTQFRWVSEINGRLIADGHQLYDPTDPKAYKLPPNTPALTGWPIDFGPRESDSVRVPPPFASKTLGQRRPCPAFC